MSETSAILPIPLVPAMIHRPDAPAHMMRIKPAARLVRIRLGGTVIAESRRALLLVEIGRDVADPVFYLPREDVTAALVDGARTTHCPLKGDTSYFDLAGGAVAEIAWSYTSPLPFAAELADHLAFDSSRTSVEIAPLPAI